MQHNALFHHPEPLATVVIDRRKLTRASSVAVASIVGQQSDFRVSASVLDKIFLSDPVAVFKGWFLVSWAAVTVVVAENGGYSPFVIHVCNLLLATQA